MVQQRLCGTAAWVHSSFWLSSSCAAAALWCSFVVQRLCGAAALWYSGFVVRRLRGTTLYGFVVQRLRAQRLCSTAASWYDTLRLLAQQFFAVQLRGTATWVQQRLCGTAALWRFRGTVALWYSGFVIQRLCTAAVSWYSGSVVQQFFVAHLRGKAACGSTGYQSISIRGEAMANNLRHQQACEVDTENEGSRHTEEEDHVAAGSSADVQKPARSRDEASDRKESQGPSAKDAGRQKSDKRDDRRVRREHRSDDRRGGDHERDRPRRGDARRQRVAERAADQPLGSARTDSLQTARAC